MKKFGGFPLYMYKSNYITGYLPMNEICLPISPIQRASEYDTTFHSSDILILLSQ